MSCSDGSLLISPFAHLIRIKRRTNFHSNGVWIGWILVLDRGSQGAPLRKGQSLEWSDANGFSKIVWWAGHILMKSQLWMFNAFSQMQTVIRSTRQWSLSHRKKKRHRETTFTGVFLRTTLWGNSRISKEEERNGPMITKEETEAQRADAHPDDEIRGKGCWLSNALWEFGLHRHTDTYTFSAITFVVFRQWFYSECKLQRPWRWIHSSPGLHVKLQLLVFYAGKYTKLEMCGFYTL